MPVGMPGAGAIDSVDRRLYLMFIMLITCQSLFKNADKVVACVAGAGFLMIAGAVKFQRRRRRKRTVGETMDTSATSLWSVFVFDAI